MGIDVLKYKVVCFVLGSLFAGVAGALYAHLYTFLSPSYFSFAQSFDPMIIIVMGGLGNMTGTIIATFLWAFTLEGMRIWLPMGFEAWRFVIYPIALLLLMLFRPQGIMGRVELGFLRAPKWPRRAAATASGNPDGGKETAA
jgi:branched-chain amino acid transport system permease protein